MKILTVAENNPAMTAGLSAGDLLIAADGLKATADLDKLQHYHSGEQIELVWLRRDELMLGMLLLKL